MHSLPKGTVRRRRRCLPATWRQQRQDAVAVAWRGARQRRDSPCGFGQLLHPQPQRRYAGRLRSGSVSHRCDQSDEVLVAHPRGRAVARRHTAPACTSVGAGLHHGHRRRVGPTTAAASRIDAVRTQRYPGATGVPDDHAPAPLRRWGGRRGRLGVAHQHPRDLQRERGSDEAVSERPEPLIASAARTACAAGRGHDGQARQHDDARART